MSSSEFLTASLSPYVATAGLGRFPKTTVMSQFSKEDLGKDLKDLDIGDDSLPLQHSLGLTWNLNTDSFVFTAPVVDNPFTRRGLLCLPLRTET
jgi:hypothetical protein